MHETQTRNGRGAMSVVLTGATSGLGLAAARALAREPGLHLILPCRVMARGQRLLGDLGMAGRGHVVALDQARPGSVREAAAAIAALPCPPIGALLLNAGMQLSRGDGRAPGWGEAVRPGGVEMTFAVNHLAPFLLANLLLPHLGDGARIVFTASGTHDPAQTTGMPWPALATPDQAAWPWADPDLAAEAPSLAGRRRYTTSKLCNVMCGYALARRIARARAAAGADIQVASFDPGLMPGTGLARDYGGVAQLAWRYVLPVLIPLVPNVNTTARSGARLARLAVAPGLEIGGRYFIGAAAARSSAASYDVAAQEALWALSARLCGLAATDGGAA